MTSIPLCRIKYKNNFITSGTFLLDRNNYMNKSNNIKLLDDTATNNLTLENFRGALQSEKKELLIEKNRGQLKTYNKVINIENNKELGKDHTIKLDLKTLIFISLSTMNTMNRSFAKQIKIFKGNYLDKNTSILLQRNNIKNTLLVNNYLLYRNFIKKLNIDKKRYLIDRVKESTLKGIETNLSLSNIKKIEVNKIINNLSLERCNIKKLLINRSYRYMSRYDIKNIIIDNKNKNLDRFIIAAIFQAYTADIVRDDLSLLKNTNNNYFLDRSDTHYLIRESNYFFNRNVSKRLFINNCLKGFYKDYSAFSNFSAYKGLKDIRKSYISYSSNPLLLQKHNYCMLKDIKNLFLARNIIKEMFILDTNIALATGNYIVSRNKSPSYLLKDKLYIKNTRHPLFLKKDLFNFIYINKNNQYLNIDKKMSKKICEKVSSKLLRKGKIKYLNKVKINKYLNKDNDKYLNNLKVLRLIDKDIKIKLDKNNLLKNFIKNKNKIIKNIYNNKFVSKDISKDISKYMLAKNVKTTSKNIFNNVFYHGLYKEIETISSHNTLFSLYKDYKEIYTNNNFRGLYKSYKDIDLLEFSKLLSPTEKIITDFNKNYLLSKGYIEVHKSLNKLLNKDRISLYKENNKLLKQDFFNQISKNYINKDLEILNRWWWTTPSIGPIDHLIVPNTDYKYNTNQLNNNNFEYIRFVDHPLLWGKDWGIDYIVEPSKVSLEVMSELINIIIMTWYKDSNRWLRCTGKEGIQFLIELIYDSYNLNTSRPNNEYYRTFRWIRWYAESIYFKNYSTGLNSIYHLILELMQYMYDHHYDVAPIWSNVQHMDHYNHIEFIKEVDKHKGKRFYLVEERK